MSIESIKNKILDNVGEGVKKVFGEKPKELLLEFPPDVKLGDFSIWCFPFAKQFKKNPAEIANLVVKKIPASSTIKKVEAVGPYLNVKVPNAILFREVCSEVIDEEESFGNTSVGKGQRVMVEYLSPNTNKPLHLGHLRNGALGMAVSNLFQATGHFTVKANLINDRGVHICKSILAWKKWANGATPKSTGIKGDHFVGDWYIRYAKEAEKNVCLEEEVQGMLRDWESGEPETIKLWKMMNDWVYDGFAQTYKKLGLEFDIFYHESDTYKLGKDMIGEGLTKKVFHKDRKGAVVFNLPEAEFGKDNAGNAKKVTVLRADGTSVYMTQDLGTALLKATKYKLNRSIYVVGSEQEYHFQCLFKILEDLGYSWAKGCYHLSYGMVYLPEGKMKSREGKIVDADDLIEKMEKLAAEEIQKRDPENKLSEEEVNSRSAKIGIGAIKFYLLRVNPSQDIHFDPGESISFDGFTGPYCQYAYARTAGILEKAEAAKINVEKLEIKDIDFSLLGNKEELLLLQKLFRFPEEVELAGTNFNPSRLVNHVYETAKTFNQFYNRHLVISIKNGELTKARLALVEAAGIVLKRGLNLLGIEVMEEM